MAPYNVRPEHSARLWKQLYYAPSVLSKVSQRGRFKFEESETVRLSHVRHMLKRQYEEWWKRELFVVTDRKMKENIPCYKVKDFDNEAVSGTFYENELQSAHVSDDAVYKIEATLGRRVRQGRREILVKWLGWPSKFNTWVEQDTVQTVPNG